MNPKIMGLFIPLLLSACIVVPPHARVHEAPAGVVYVAPDYPAPAPAYVWEYHSNYGWGWHHPRYGWYRRGRR